MKYFESFIAILLALFLHTQKVSGSFSAIQSPNIIIILTDDQGWGDLSNSGNTNLHTPNIDNLVKTGITFDRFFVSPVCSPTRAELLTGRYHVRGGVYSTFADGERLNTDETTIAENINDQDKLNDYHQIIRQLLQSNKSTVACKKTLCKEFAWMANDSYKEIYVKLKQNPELAEEAQYALEMMEDF